MSSRTKGGERQNKDRIPGNEMLKVWIWLNIKWGENNELTYKNTVFLKKKKVKIFRHIFKKDVWYFHINMAMLYTVSYIMMCCVGD
jgi:hypothetical protein